MSNVLTRQLGPLPTWGWLALGTGGIVLGLFLRSRVTTPGQSPATGGIDPYTGAGYQAGGIDPATGIPYNLEYGGTGGLSTGAGGVSGGTADYSQLPPTQPTFADELGDVANVIGILQGLGLTAPAQGAPEQSIDTGPASSAANVGPAQGANRAPSGHRAPKTPAPTPAQTHHSPTSGGHTVKQSDIRERPAPSAQHAVSVPKAPAGEAPHVRKVKGGEWHTYSNGRTVFVAHHH